MNLPRNPEEPSQDEPIAGEPLLTTPVAPADPPERDDLSGPIDYTETRVESEPILPSPTQPDTRQREGGEPSERDSGGKVRTAALLAGAAAVANKVRHEAPKKLHDLREKRAAGRCVILTEADGDYLVVGPYKNEEAARQDIFKVGGTPRVVELRSQSSFFTQEAS